MALQAASTVPPISPQVIGNAFVQQYYHILHRTPVQVHKFYQDSSILSRADSNGSMSSVSTLQAINDKILSMDFSNYFTEIETADTQLSHKDGVLIVVTGSLTGTDNVRRKFTQSFFLAPQENGGFFVLNDVFRFISERQLGETNPIIINHANENAPNASLISEPEPAPVKEHPALDLPDAVPESEASSGEEAIDPSVNGSRAETNVNVDPPVQVSMEDAKQVPDAAAPPVQKAVVPAQRAAPPAQKDAPKKSYASIVKVMKETPPPAPVNAKAKTTPKTTTKVSENVEKPVTAPAKPDQTPETLPPNDKNVSENNTHDEQGYSVYVRNLPLNATPELVEEEFKKFGPIKPGGVQVRSHKVDRFCFGFVEFESLKSMQSALEASPITMNGRQVFIEEKRTTTRVVNGVVTRGDSGTVGGARFPSGRGGFRGDNFRGRGGFMNSGGYNKRSEFRRGEYTGRGRAAPVRSVDGYQSGNGYQQRAFQYGNGRFGRFNGPRQTPVAA